MPNDTPYTHCLPAGTQLKDYRIDQVLGKGGFGITYLAEDLNLRKQVAIKELLPDGIASRGTGFGVVPQSQSLESDYRWAVSAFLKEAQILAGFEHPNIVHVYRLFEANDTAYMVMPFIRGVSLKDKVKTAQSLTYEECKKILLSLLDGLEIVHRANILHRDIKPDNIILNKNGLPILIDFGAARQQIGGKTQDITSIITPGYAPVEQYSTDAKYQGPWSDIYALAACSFFMITGRKPIPASERSDAQRHRAPDPLPNLVDLAPHGYPSEFLQAIDDALQLAETKRPQSITAWRTMLNQSPTPAFQPSPPNFPPHSAPSTPEIPTTPPTAPTVLSPPRSSGKKKNKLLIASIGTLLLTILIAGGLVIWDNRPDEPNKPAKSNGHVQATFTKIEAYLDVNRPNKAKTTLDGIDPNTLSPDEKQRYQRLEENIKKLITGGTSSLAVLIEPSSATATINGQPSSWSNGKITFQGLGNHTLRISADGYSSKSVNFECKKIGAVIRLNKITLKPNSKIQHVITLIKDLERELKKEDFSKIVRLVDQLDSANIPSQLNRQSSRVIKDAKVFIKKNKWLVTLHLEQVHAKAFLNGALTPVTQIPFKTNRPGDHKLRIRALGFNEKKITFTIKPNGEPIDLGIIALSPIKRKEPIPGLSKANSLKLAKSFITHGNSTYANDAQMQFLHTSVYFGDDQKNAKTIAEIKKQTTTLFTRWTTRTFAFTAEPATATLSDSKKSWMVSVPYTFTWKDPIFTFQGKRTGLFAIMPINGKPRIVAYRSNSVGEDQRSFDDKALIAALKKHNQTRLIAGDSDGGESVQGEASYYSNHTEYYGDLILTRNEIAAKIRKSRAKSKFRAYQALSYSDFIVMDKEDKSRRTFSYKCVTEVVKDSGRANRTERITIQFIEGKPYITSVRY